MGAVYCSSRVGKEPRATATNRRMVAKPARRTRTNAAALTCRVAINNPLVFRGQKPRSKSAAQASTVLVGLRVAHTSTIEHVPQHKLERILDALAQPARELQRATA